MENTVIRHTFTKIRPKSK